MFLFVFIETKPSSYRARSLTHISQYIIINIEINMPFPFNIDRIGR